MNVVSKQQVIDQINALTVEGEFSQNDVNYLINYLIANGEFKGTPRDLIQIRRGNQADIPTLAQGELAFTLDTQELYVGGTGGNVNIVKKSAWVDVTSSPYNAKGNGITDDTAAIQAAINDVHEAGGGTVYLPQGTYRYKGNTGGNFITLRSNVTLRGAGKEVTKLLLSSDVSGLSNAGIYVTDNSHDCGIMDISFDGNQRGTQLQAVIFIAPNAKRTIVRDVNIRDHYCSLANVFLYDAMYSKISNVSIEGATNSYEHLIYIDASSPGKKGYNRVENCDGNNGGFGFSVRSSSHNTFINCIATADNFNSLEGFNMNGGQYNSVIECSSIGRGDGGYVETDDIGLGNRPKFNRVIGFSAIGNKLTGVVIDGSDGIYSNLICRNNSQDPSYQQRWGVFVTPNALRCTIDGVNAVDDQTVPTQTHGLFIQAGAKEITYKNIQGYGNATQLIDDATTQLQGRPKFIAHLNGVHQTISTGSATKIGFGTTDVNSGECFNLTTKRFEPKKSGVYSVHAAIGLQSLGDGVQCFMELRKNGSSYRWLVCRGGGGNQSFEISCLANMKKGDYLELFVTQDSGVNQIVTGNATDTFFEGYLLDD